MGQRIVLETGQRPITLQRKSEPNIVLLNRPTKLVKRQAHQQSIISHLAEADRTSISFSPPPLSSVLSPVCEKKEKRKPFLHYYRQTKSVTTEKGTTSIENGAIRWRPLLDQHGHLLKVATNKVVLEFSVPHKSTPQGTSHRTPLSSPGTAFTNHFFRLFILIGIQARFPCKWNIMSSWNQAWLKFIRELRFVLIGLEVIKIHIDTCMSSSLACLTYVKFNGS